MTSNPQVARSNRARRVLLSPDFSYSGMSLEAVSSVSFRVTINFPAF
jgi:hypothetical protein